MARPDMLQMLDYGALAPLREAAGMLAEQEWPRLYDEGRLRDNEDPVAASVVADDPYGPAELLAPQRVSAQRPARRLRPDPTSCLIDLATGRA